MPEIMWTNAEHPEFDPSVIEVDDLLRKIFNYLSERERGIIIDRWIYGYTFTEIARKQNCTREKIRQVELRARIKMDGIRHWRVKPRLTWKELLK